MNTLEHDLRDAVLLGGKKGIGAPPGSRRRAIWHALYLSLWCPSYHSLPAPMPELTAEEAARIPLAESM